MKYSIKPLCHGAGRPIFVRLLQNGYQSLCHPSDGDNNLTDIHQFVLSVEMPTTDVVDLSLKFGVRIM